MVEPGLEIRMQREPVFAVRGRAIDANGQPLQRFTVNARRSGAGPSLYLGSPPTLFTGGEFALPGLRSGTWILTAVPMGTIALSIAEIQVGSSPVDGVVLRPVPKQEISGTGVLEGAGSREPDWSRVGMTLVSSSGAGFGVAVPTLGPNGQFELVFMGTGKAWLNITGVPAPGTYLARVVSGSEDVTGKELDIPAGGLPPLKLVFRPGAAVLSGRAENPDPNTLAARPTISLWPAFGPPILNSGMPGRRSPVAFRRMAHSRSRMSVRASIWFTWGSDSSPRQTAGRSRPRIWRQGPRA